MSALKFYGNHVCVHHVLTINKFIQSDLQKIIMLVYGWVDLGVLWLISGVIFLTIFKV
jgi:hypothetical protein